MDDERVEELERRIEHIIEEGERTGPPEELEEDAYAPPLENPHLRSRCSVGLRQVGVALRLIDTATPFCRDEAVENPR